MYISVELSIVPRVMYTYVCVVLGVHELYYCSCLRSILQPIWNHKTRESISGSRYSHIIFLTRVWIFVTHYHVAFDLSRFESYRLLQLGRHREGEKTTDPQYQRHVDGWNFCFNTRPEWHPADHNTEVEASLTLTQWTVLSKKNFYHSLTYTETLNVLNIWLFVLNIFCL